MPSIVQPTSVKSKFSTLSKAKVSQPVMAEDGTNEHFGIVNYINGVPVSIHLQAQEFPIGVTSWKQNMRRRNQKLHNDDVNKMHHRN